MPSCAYLIGNTEHEDDDCITDNSKSLLKSVTIKKRTTENQQPLPMNTQTPKNKYQPGMHVKNSTHGKIKPHHDLAGVYASPINQLDGCTKQVKRHLTNKNGKGETATICEAGRPKTIDTAQMLVWNRMSKRKQTMQTKRKLAETWHDDCEIKS